MNNNKVSIKVPATSANLGPGFDIVGMALNIFCEVDFSISGDSLKISGCPTEYANDKNLTFVGFSKTLKYCNVDVPKGLEISIKSDIPISRGLGSSSALIVAGILAANYLYKLKLSKDTMLKIATDIEGHPDNVAPCIFGGFVTSWISNGECFETSYPISKDLRFAVIIPSYEVSTEKARAILPDKISRQDAVFSVAHFGMLLNGISSGESRVLKEALYDKIHQPYRKELIKDFDEIHRVALENEALGLVISGSGSTMLIVGNVSTDFASIKEHISTMVNKIDFRLVSPCLEGATCQTNS